GLSAGTRQVANTLSLARQYAITQRAKVRVVFPYSQTTTVGTNMAHPYQSYAVVSLTFTNDALPPVTNYLSKWEHLPLGTVFMNDSSLLGPSPTPCLDNLSTNSFPFPYTNSPPATLAYIEFTPWGAATKNLNPDFTTP